MSFLVTKIDISVPFEIQSEVDKSISKGTFVEIFSYIFKFMHLFKTNSRLKKKRG